MADFEPPGGSDDTMSSRRELVTSNAPAIGRRPTPFPLDGSSVFQGRADASTATPLGRHDTFFGRLGSKRNEGDLPGLSKLSSGRSSMIFKSLRLTLKYDENSFPAGLDLQLFCFLYDKEARYLDCIFYRNPEDANGGIALDQEHLMLTLDLNEIAVECFFVVICVAVGTSGMTIPDIDDGRIEISFNFSPTPWKVIDLTRPPPPSEMKRAQQAASRSGRLLLLMAEVDGEWFFKDVHRYAAPTIDGLMHPSGEVCGEALAQLASHDRSDFVSVKAICSAESPMFIPPLQAKSLKTVSEEDDEQLQSMDTRRHIDRLLEEVSGRENEESAAKERSSRGSNRKEEESDERDSGEESSVEGDSSPRRRSSKRNLSTAMQQTLSRASTLKQKIQDLQKEMMEAAPTGARGGDDITAQTARRTDDADSVVGSEMNPVCTAAWRESVEERLRAVETAIDRLEHRLSVVTTRVATFASAFSSAAAD